MGRVGSRTLKVIYVYTYSNNTTQCVLLAASETQFHRNMSSQRIPLRILKWQRRTVFKDLQTWSFHQIIILTFIFHCSIIACFSAGGKKCNNPKERIYAHTFINHKVCNLNMHVSYKSEKLYLFLAQHTACCYIFRGQRRKVVNYPVMKRNISVSCFFAGLPPGFSTKSVKPSISCTSLWDEKACWIFQTGSKKHTPPTFPRQLTSKRRA